MHLRLLLLMKTLFHILKAKSSHLLLATRKNKKEKKNKKQQKKWTRFCQKCYIEFTSSHFIFYKYTKGATST